MANIRFGMAGLGRLGYRHAENIAFRTPGAELAAVCSVVPGELVRAAQSFPRAARYADYGEMLKHEGLDAIFLCTPSGLHVAQIEAGLKAGFHVFSEKPLGVTVAECEHAEQVVAAHPNQVFMLGFMRRYDPPCAYAKRLIDEGRIGKPFMVRAYGLDPEALVQGALKFAPTSGGIFLDMAVHDIDLANWYLGGTPASVWAIGGAFVHPEFVEFGDCDNACAMFQYKDGGMAFLYVGRTAPHGYHIETEIIGTKGTLRVSPVPQKNLVQIFNSDGVLQECVGGFLERFESAYLNELHEFVDCIRQGRKPDVHAEDGTAATRIAFAATESYRERRIVAENLLTANPNLKGIFATNDEMALGAANAAKSAGKTLVIVGFDATNDALKAIEDGSMSGSVAQFPTKIGELGTLTAAKVARGEKVDAFVNTGVEVVSKDNLSNFMK